MLRFVAAGRRTNLAAGRFERVLRIGLRGGSGDTGTSFTGTALAQQRRSQRHVNVDAIEGNRQTPARCGQRVDKRGQTRGTNHANKHSLGALRHRCSNLTFFLLDRLDAWKKQQLCRHLHQQKTCNQRRDSTTLTPQQTTCYKQCPHPATSKMPRDTTPLCATHGAQGQCIGQE